MATSLRRSNGTSLRELFSEASIIGDKDILVSSICSDSRQVRPGDLFVAISGVDHDGHDHVCEAVERGAIALLVDRQVPVAGTPTCVVSDTRTAYGQLCQRLAGDPSRQMRVVGVTGTNGKTTTATLIQSVLNKGGARSGLLTTLGYSDGYDSAPASHTTPPAPVLAQWMARATAQCCSHTVMEVSSHALSQSRIAGIEFDAAVVTNVGHDHLDYHGSVENYRNAKGRLLDQLSTSGALVLNIDDPTCVRLLSSTYHPALTVSMKSEAEVTASVVERHSCEQTFLLTAGSDTVPVRTRIIGGHHVYNCLSAAAVGLIYGIELHEIVRGIEAVTTIPGRMEPIVCGQAFPVFVDYAHTPDALRACLTSLREVTPGRLICVFGAGGERDRQKRPLMGRAADRLADVAIVTNDNPRNEDPRLIVSDVRAGFEQSAEVHSIFDRAEAIAFALETAEPDDCVVIAGKGHERHQIIGTQRTEFSDQKVAEHVLRQLCPARKFAA